MACKLYVVVHKVRDLSDYPNKTQNARSKLKKRLDKNLSIMQIQTLMVLVGSA